MKKKTQKQKEVKWTEGQFNALLLDIKTIQDRLTKLEQKRMEHSLDAVKYENKPKTDTYCPHCGRRYDENIYPQYPKVTL